MHEPTRHFHVRSALRFSPARIEPDVARGMVARGALLVDVRRRDDPAMTLDGSVRIPPDEIPAHAHELAERAGPIVLACG